MTGYQIDLLGYIFLWTIIILSLRNNICKHKKLWALISATLGLILIVSSIIYNCNIAYESKITNLKFDTEVILDTLFLRTPEKHEMLYLWRMSIFGYSSIAGGFIILITCRYFLEKRLHGKWNLFLSIFLSVIVALLFVLLIKTLFGYL